MAESVLDFDKDFNMLSLHDLLAARDLYHLHMMAKQHVVGTAVGRYLIRKSDPWPTSREDLRNTGLTRGVKKKARTLDNSEMRPYSWPCVLVFVDEWADHTDPSSELLANDVVSKALSMPDGSRVPVCLVYAPLQELAPPRPIPMNFPDHWIGGGFPLLIDSQGEERVASIGCLVTDGHTVYALTNRHVTGEPGTPVYTYLRGEKVRIGVSSAKQLVSKRFQEIYPAWPGHNVYLNLDVGLVEIDDLHDWTAQIYGIGRMGKLADLSADNISLRLIDCPVTARGAISGPLAGKIKGLFYRYKAVGGFEFVADCLIGPDREKGSLETLPGDSGTVWVLGTEKPKPAQGTGKAKKVPDIETARQDPRPVAVQWGGQQFIIDGKGKTSPYALASFLSTACVHLSVEPIRDWNLGSVNYWGAVGHYTIAVKAIEFLSEPGLLQLMNANLERISFAAAEISGKSTSGLSKHDFVPLADVPDLVWKIAKKAGGGRGGPEHPNHFADMDAKNEAGHTLLQLCQMTDASIEVEVWRSYYTEVKDEGRGLLPFRAWQFYTAMVEYVRKRDYAAFVCAAGTLAHYIGDACQPLHISRMFDGDPADTEMAWVRNRTTGEKERKEVPRARGVHTSYEKDMVNYHVVEIVKGITKKVGNVGEPFRGGRGAALGVVRLMGKTFEALPPARIVETYQELKDRGSKPKEIADVLWDEFGQATIEAMADGCRCLASVWQSAWLEGGGENDRAVSKKAIDEDKLSDLYKDQDFVRSYTLDKIGPHLVADG